MLWEDKRCTGHNELVNLYCQLLDDDLVSVQERVITSPSKFILYPAYPNPFNSEAIIEYNLNIPGNYDLTVHDLTGREVTRLARGWQNIGSHQTVWDARGLGSGTYLIRLDGGMDQSMKVVNLVK